MQAKPPPVNVKSSGNEAAADLSRASTLSEPLLNSKHKEGIHYLRLIWKVWLFNYLFSFIVNFIVLFCIAGRSEHIVANPIPNSPFGRKPKIAVGAVELAGYDFFQTRTGPCVFWVPHPDDSLGSPSLPSASMAVAKTGVVI